MSAEVQIRGCIEIRTYDRSKEVKRLLACPFCGHAFADNEHRWKHFLDNHDPEDAGLSPLNEPTPELVTDGGEDVHDDDRADDLHAGTARADLEHALFALENIDGESHARARYHVREAISTLDAAQEVDR